MSIRGKAWTHIVVDEAAEVIPRLPERLTGSLTGAFWGGMNREIQTLETFTRGSADASDAGELVNVLTRIEFSDGTVIEVEEKRKRVIRI